MAENEANPPLNENRKSISPSFEKKSNSEKTRCRKVRKRKKPLSDEDIDLESEKESEIDISLEKKLRECARRNNLSPLEVKKLLRKIVGNDHVLALVKLQEEELNKNESLSTPSKIDKLSSLKDYNEKSIDTTPKLTRAKAKALNKKPVSLPSLNEIEPEPEVTALITEEMNTDDEDDEYDPKEEDYVYSEDDFNTTISDLDSQPRTPLENVSYCSEAESPNKIQLTSPKYSSDGVFKIPRERTTSGLTKEDEIIAKRTRSKLCLQTTSIETIESNFMPPDITRDMYDIDNEIDQEWAQFLNEFSKPLNNTATAEEDDPEDPEYVAADKIPIDAEELKDVNISKKELSDLVAELFDGLIQEGVFLENIPDLETPRKTSDEIIIQRSATKSPQKKKSKFCIKSQPIFTSPTCEHFSDNNLDMSAEPVGSESLISMNSNTNEIMSQNCLGTTENFINNHNESVFSPNIMSTPCVNTQTARTIRQTTQEVTQIVDYNYISNQSIYNQAQSNTTVVNCISPNARVYPYEIGQNYSSRVISSFNIEPQSTNYATIAQQPVVNETTGSHQRTVTLIAYPANGGPPCYKKVPISSISLMNTNDTNLGGQPPIIATLDNVNETSYEFIDLTTDSTCIPQPKLYGSSFRTKSGFISHSELYEMWKGDAHKSAEKYYKMFYERKYNTTLKNIGFTTSSKNYDPTKIGFTSDQKKLFEQQLRIHVQILTQNYLQTYSHPQLWQKAKSQKDMLLDLENKSEANEKSAFNAWNLKNAITLINEWEIELSEENEENQNFMDFIHHQIERIESNRRPRSHRIIKFAPKTMKKILKSNVFLYPEFLPRLPFISSSHLDYHYLAPVESHLLAFELEKYLPTALDLKNKEHRKSKSAIKLACDKISDDIMTGKSGRRLYDFYKQEMESDNYNPIKYFNERGKAPPFQHFLKQFDISCILPPISKKHQLPMLWKEFATELQVSESNHEVDSNLTNEIVWAKTKQDMKLRRKERKEQKKERRKDKERLREQKNKKSGGQNVIINLNYVLENPSKYDINGEQDFETNNLQYNNNSTSSTALVTKMERRTSITDYSQVFTRIHEPLDIKFRDDASYLQHLNVQYPKNNLENCSPAHINQFTNNEVSENMELEETSFRQNPENPTRSSDQKRLTDYFPFAPSNKNDTTKKSESIAYNNDVPKIFLSKKTLQSHSTEQRHEQQEKRLLKLFKIQNRGLKFSLRRSRYGFRSFRIIKRLKERKRLRNKLQNLLFRYWKYLYQKCNKYKNIFLKKCFIHFQKIEIYSDFLEDLKILCHTADSLYSKQSKITTTENGESSSETMSTVGESLIQIIMPRSSEIHKESENVINSTNFFEKVEERFCNSGKDIKFKKFLSILKSFNPENNSILWFYNKMEKIFLPDHIDLAEIFLHFLLPVETSEASYFFRNYMISNKENFIETLNQYFEKYQTIIPKIYECLMKLDQQNVELQTEDIKIQLLSLINHDPVLEEWLKQIFVEENFENTDIHSSRTSIAFEVSDLISSLSELQPSELKYINARSTSTSKVFLPENLIFLANSLINNKTIAVVSVDNSQHNKNDMEQVHNNIESDITISDKKKSEEECEFKNIKDLIENDSLDSSNNNESKTISQIFNSLDIDENNTSSVNQKEIPSSPEIIPQIDNDHSSKLLIDESMQENINNKNENEVEEKSEVENYKFNFSNDKTQSEILIKNKPLSQSEPKEIPETELKTNKKIRNKNDPIQNDCENNEQGGEKDNLQTNSKCEEAESITQNLSKNTDLNKIEWSRDEDRTILEEATLDFDTHENLIQSICGKLPSRNLTEITDRYSFLINLLSQLKNS